MQRKYLLLTMILVLCLSISLFAIGCETNSDEEENNEVEDNVVEQCYCQDKELQPAVKATCDKDGNIEYYKCKQCGKLYVYDEEFGKYTEVTKEDVIIKGGHKLKYYFNELEHWTVCEVCGEKSKREAHAIDEQTHKCVCGQYDSTYYTEGMQFELCNNDTEYAVSLLTGDDLDVVVVPSMYDGKRVTKINNDAFRINSIGRLVLAPTINEIGEALRRTHVKEMNLPMSLHIEDMYDTYGMNSGIVHVQDMAIVDDLLYGEDVKFGEDIIESDVYDYILSDGKIYIARYKGTDSVLNIPEKIDGFSVAGIAANTFKGNTNLTEVTFPNGMEMISCYAFSGCTNIKVVNIPESLKYVSKDAFKDCTSIIRVNVKDMNKWINIKFLNQYANPVFYAKDIYLYGEKVVDVVLSDEPVLLNNYALAGAVNIRSIENSKVITGVGKGALYGCTGIDVLDLRGINHVSTDAFYGCDMLVFADDYLSYSNWDNGFTGYMSRGVKDIVFADNVYYTLNYLDTFTVTGITEDATEVIIKDSIEYNGKMVPVEHIEEIATKMNRPKLVKLSIPSTINRMTEYMLDNAPNVTSLKLPYIGIENGDIEKLGILFSGKYDINNNTLKELSLDNVNIRDNTLEGFNALEVLGINGTIEYIDSDLATIYPSLKRIDVPNIGVWLAQSFEYNDFNPISVLELTINGAPFTSIDIDANTKTIGKNCFKGYKGTIDSFKIAADVSEELVIPAETFEGMTIADANIPARYWDTAIKAGAKKITINSGDIIKGEKSTSEVLEYLYIPASIKEIAGSYSLYNLRQVEAENVDALVSAQLKNGSMLFSAGVDIYCNGTLVEEIVVPDGTTVIKSNAFNGFKSVKKLTIPDTVKEVGQWVLGGCNVRELICPTIFIRDDKFSTVEVLKLIGVGGLYDRLSEWPRLQRLYIGADVNYSNSEFDKSNVVVYIEDGTYPMFYDATSPVKSAIAWRHNNITTNADYDYVLNKNNDAIITNVKIKGSQPNITVPSSIDGHKVISIGHAFSRDDIFTNRVILPNTLEYVTPHAFDQNPLISSVEFAKDSVCQVIGYSAFNKCIELGIVSLPYGLKEIGARAFANCLKLDRCYIPASVTHVGDRLTWQCNNSKYCIINLDTPFLPVGWADEWNVHRYDGSPGYTYPVKANINHIESNVTTNSEYDYVVDNGKAYITQYKGTKVDVVVPESIDGYKVVSIGMTFSKNNKIKSITLPSGITYIHRNTFYSCTSLKNIYTSVDLQCGYGSLNSTAGTVVSKIA